MSGTSTIEWTDATWNPVSGCTKVSAGCDHCYAERITERFHSKGSFAEVKLYPNRLDAPLRWRKPRLVFVNSMSDLFHKDVPDEFIARVFAIMSATPLHTYQILTKRPMRMRSLLTSGKFRDLWLRAWSALPGMNPCLDLPSGNVWLGVSVENQKAARLRIPALRDTPAVVRFLSCEPLLAPVDLSPWLDPDLICDRCDAQCSACPFRPEPGRRLGHCPGIMCDDPCSSCPLDSGETPGIDWVIVGGESGPGARPMRLEWAESLVAQCRAAGVTVFVNQMGSRWGKDHHDIDRFPESLRVREYPAVRGG